MFQSLRSYVASLLGLLLMVGSSWLGPPAALAGNAVDESAARALFAEHCLHCHGADVQEAGFRLDRLEADFGSRRTAEHWIEVMDRINSGDMPPESEPPLDAEASLRVAEWIAEQLRQAQLRGDGLERVVIRRLNRAEYNNTIRDLLGVDFDPAADFPEDPPAHGFDNIGAALQISPLLMEKYLAAAREVAEQVIAEGPRPPFYQWHMEVEEAHASNQFEGRRSAGRDELWVDDPHRERNRYLVKGGGKEVESGFVVKGGWKDESAAGFRWFKIPVAGEYRIRIRAAGRVPTRDEVIESVRQIRLEHQEQEWQNQSERNLTELRRKWLEEEWPEIEAHFRDDPIYDFGFPRMKVTSDEGVVIGVVSVEADPQRPAIFEFTFEFDAVPNSTVGVSITNDYQVPRLLENFWFQQNPRFRRPELLVDWVEIEGIAVSSWPPQAHQDLLPESPLRTNNPTAYVRQILDQLLPRAWRRPVSSAEVDRLVRLFEVVRDGGASFEQSMRMTLVAVLSSPHFLYLVEPEQVDALVPLDDFQIASRLSYFLWSSMPDDELFEAAAEGRLTDAFELRAQVDRMLADPRSKALNHNFTTQWLGLREIGANPPVENLFPRYDDHLEVSMVEESEAFFAEILRQDLSAVQLLASDFVVVNERMARFYGLSGVEGDRFRRVEVPDQSMRGGVMTQASVLTVTSNGTRTSPVIRGTWILENLLGDPPPPPPPDAGDLAPQVPGIDKATVRDRLMAHREIAQCASCHQKIDPLGFALENFDAHGRWRDRYGFGYNGRVGRNDPVVDAQASLPDGTSFNGVDGLQQVLLNQQDRFLHCFAEKLATYGLGRPLGYAEQDRIDQFVQEMKSEGTTIRSLIKQIVTSEAFLTK